MLLDIATVGGGLALLVVAASVLVQGASAVALRMGLSPLIVGLTVVAFGTSAPELVVSVQATLRGAGGIAVGNVVGSNVANVGLILGLAALLHPIASDRAVLRRDLPVLVAATAFGTLVLLDGSVGRIEGVALVTGLGAYLAWSLRTARRDRDISEGAAAASPGAGWRDVLFVGLGLGGLVLGADLFVGGAVGLAERVGLSNAVIGLTVVAVGTSLPELATSLVAAARGESEIAVGNVVGSNLFNLLGILGTAALVRPLDAPGLGLLDLAVMSAFVVVLVPMMWSGRRLSRAEGALLAVGYAAYVTVLVVHHV